MKISLIGNGKMGKAIAKLAKQNNHTIINTFDINNKQLITTKNLQKADVVFEFTQPETAVNNILKCFEANVPCVCGTTGWTKKLPEIRKKCTTENKTLLYAANFSIGVNILFKINSYLAKIMNKYNYDINISETHHIHKKDEPSGTAIQIAQDIINNIDRKNNWTLNNTNEKKNIPIFAHRQNEIPGIHSIKYFSEIDEIEIKHSAKNRTGLAIGAIIAAEFVKNKTGFFTMEDILK